MLGAAVHDADLLLALCLGVASRQQQGGEEEVEWESFHGVIVFLLCFLAAKLRFFYKMLGFE